MRHQIYSPVHQHLSVRLRQARLDAGLTQVELGRLTGRTQAYISKFERGQLRLDVGDYIIFTKVLQVDAHALIDELAELAEYSVSVRVVEGSPRRPETNDQPHPTRWTGKEFLAWMKDVIEKEGGPFGKPPTKPTRQASPKRPK